jgi:hypothetical protein
MKLSVIAQKVQKFFEGFLQPKTAIIRAKSNWQERYCINVGFDSNCKREATFEAFFREGKLNAAVRCCANPACQAEAKRIAKRSVQTKTQS